MCGLICLPEKAQDCSVPWSSHSRGLESHRARVLLIARLHQPNSQLMSHQLPWHPVNEELGREDLGSGCFQDMQDMCHLKCGSSPF